MKLYIVPFIMVNSNNVIIGTLSFHNTEKKNTMIIKKLFFISSIKELQNTCIITSIDVYKQIKDTLY